MSIQFRFLPGSFVKHDDIKLFGVQASAHVARKLKEKSDQPVGPKSLPAPLRDTHIVLLAIDVLVALHAAFRKWRNHRRTLKALDELDEHQLRDIGLTREQVSDGHFKYRPLAGANDPEGPTETKSGLLQTPGCYKAFRPSSAYSPFPGVMCSDRIGEQNVKRHTVWISTQHVRQSCGTDPHGQER